uniref:hypothetical protein n=1 Tax=Nonomuraea candida TaxID=359159 RepID=UPI0005BE6A12
MATTTPQRNRRQPTALQGVLASAVQATGALAATGALGDVFDLNPVWGAVGTVAAPAATVVPNARHASPSALLYRLSCWCGAGSWLTWVLATGLWQTGTFAALGIGALAATLASPLASRDRQRLEVAAGRGALVLRSTSRLAQDWERRIARVCTMNVLVEDLRFWPGRTGYDLLVRLPGGGRTRSDLERGADALASDARLPNGCGVEVTKGPDRGSAWLRVGTVNRLAETIPYPEDFTATSFLDPKVLGEFRDGSPVQVILRQKAGLFTGQRGSGKTGLLHVTTAEVGRSRDAIVIHIDLNGGGVSQAWLDPWIEGEIERCPLGWAASNIEEAVLVSRALLAIAKDRKKSTRRIKKAANSQLLPISPELPAYVVLMDESAEGMAASAHPLYAEFRANMEEVQRIGRNEAVEVYFSALRATSDVISPNVKKQSTLRIGMFVQDAEEIAYLFGWNKGISIEDLDGPGCAFIQHDQERPRPFKAAFMEFLQIGRAAVAISRIRPEFDPAAVRAARAAIGDLFDTRYDRMREAFTDLDPDDEHEDGDEGQAAALPAVHTPAPAPVVPQQQAGGFTLEFGANMADWPQVPELIARALAVFQAAGDTRIHSEDLAVALGFPSKTELAAALASYGVTALKNPFERNGQRRRGYDRADFLSATQGDRREEAGEGGGPHDPHV